MDIADYIDEVVLSLVTKAINHVASIAEIHSDIDNVRAMTKDLDALIENHASERDIAAQSSEVARIAEMVQGRAGDLKREVERISIDINEVMGSVEDLNAARLKSDRENRSKTLFLARMSHELRTPMNAIIGMSELAEREYGHPVCLEHIRDIKQAGANLLSIINDILDFSKIESGNLQITSSAYCAASLLNDVMTIIRVRLADSGVRFITSIAPDIPSRITGDAGRIRQILLNLLSNAVKYTKDGFIKFTSSCEREGGTVLLRFTVEDSGAGIKPEDMGRLFGDFERVDMKRNTGIEGAGLGLSIARSLCRAMGGDITVTSEYGKGSFFTATILQSFEGCAPIGNIEEKAASVVGNTEVSFIAPGFRVLVIDDIDVNLKIAKGLLAPFEMDVDVCSSGREALSMILESEYDLIFMDHMMPDMDGIEATAVIRSLEDERFKGLPIVALTANAVSGMKEMFLEHGFNDFLSKPIEIHRLYELIERWVPREKRVKPEGRTCDYLPVSETDLRIEGLNTSRGLAATGGTAEGYIKVLELYCRDAAKRLEILSSAPDGKSLTPFTTQVHALKSASASIGAENISRLAAELEEAGKKGRIDLIEAEMPTFREHLSGLVSQIRLALAEYTRDNENGADGRVSDPAYQEALSRLRNALLAENVGDADALLEGLGAMPIGSKAKETLSAVAGLVLTSEFEDAASMIDGLIKEDSR
ncbi:MAG: response regulator [Synergistaceae bacterium]|jgi:signal transduction histidine kinase/HPt (histidine-containing phosphotransfer) domain-containing protein/ActR/RegA family two-component response regulator|nr:response regulator [Synergistaceae bacterium]